MPSLVQGSSPQFIETLATADRYAAHDWPVLLLGETGVGKELLARRIHEHSSRGRAVFLPINCAALPHGLFESELFGYEKGAFSGANQNSRGLVRGAQGGTLFLDEIGELDLGLQGKLLRLLDSGELRAVGSSQITRVDVRVIAATNVDLHRAVALGSFRRDLLERLSVLLLKIPSLRERREDILPIARAWLQDLGVPVEEDFLQPLLDFDWPGNIRQLRNILVRVCVLSLNRPTLSLLLKVLAAERADATTLPFAGGDLLQGSLADMEKQVIVQKLKQCHGSRKQTAAELGISKSSLHEKIRKWKEDGTTFAQPLARYRLTSV